jgi:CHAT domain-containing protein
MACARLERDATRARLASAGRHGLALIGAILFGVAAAPAAAQPGGALLSDRLCVLDARSGPADAPTDRDLVRVAASAERGIATLRAAGDPAAADRIALTAPAGGSEAPSDQAVALYCAAAGEAMRLGSNGSQAQAVTYLLTAFRRATAAGDETLAARAAYRLALVGGADPAPADSRGGGSAPTRVADLALAPTLETSAPDAAAAPGALACAELADLRLRAVTLEHVSITALECAAHRALGAGDARLAALANLRLARFDAGLAETPGADRDGLRASARQRALDTIAIALAVEPAEIRIDLVGRVIDSAIDFGGAADPAAAVGIAALRRESGLQGAAIAAALEGRVALAGGDAPTARARLRSAILSESQRPLPARLPVYYLRLAEADPDRRDAHVQTAYTALENLRPLLPRFDPLTEETSFALYMRHVFIAAVEVQLADAVGADESLRIRGAQRIVEAYREAELQSAFGSECLPPRAAVRPEELLPGEILLYPLLLPDRIELLYVAGGEAAGGAPRYRRLPPNRDADRQVVTELVEQVVLSLSGGGGDAGWRAPSRRLYDLLIAPVADQLVPGAMLAVVPDGPLRALPFAALLAPDGRYLVQQTRLSLIPALAYSQPDGVRRGERLNIVAASLQRQISLPVGFFPELAGTAEEARIAVSHAGAGRLVPDFTRAELESALDGRRIDVLHLATHATFNGRSDRAFIVANGEVIRLSELREMIDRTRIRGETLDLIVLSACETAVGDEQTGMGLAGAAVQAGARSVIGSLWQVSDAGTAELMGEFYRLYSAGTSRSAALRDAQLAMIAQGGDAADPNVWAAFALLGAWR